MTITLVSFDVPPVRTVIARDDKEFYDQGMGVIAWSQEPAIETQIRAGCRWAAVSPQDRGNEKQTITFTTSFTDSRWTLTDSIVYCLDRRNSIPTLAAVEIDTAGSNSRQLRHIAQAVVEVVGTRIKGLTVETTYRITGGAITES